MAQAISEPRFSRMETGLRADRGLDLWEPIPAEHLASGTPVQHGRFYLNDTGLGLSAGVWECTPFTGKGGPYSCHEFMTLLEGTVRIHETSGRVTTIEAGESFFIPKGLPCTWEQPSKVRKFFVIYDDPATAPVPAGWSGGVLKVDPKVALAPADGPDPALCLDRVPQWHDAPLHASPDGQVSVGVWSTTAYTRKVVPFPRYELMHLLEGCVTLTDGAGRSEVFEAGETIWVPKGAPLGWSCQVPVRKIYCIVQPKAVAAKLTSDEALALGVAVGAAIL